MKVVAVLLAALAWLTACQTPTSAPQSFAVRGIIRAIKPDEQILIIAHEAIPNFMDAMTMPFKLKPGEPLGGLQLGDEIRFRLRVTGEESWIEGIAKTGKHAAVPMAAPAGRSNTPATAAARHPLLDYAFTNQFGQPVRLSQFHGQALAITFFFTRCPIPDFCPRLSRNFAEASQKLAALPNGPTNWQFLSVTFDAEHDTPAVLAEYGKRYNYDPRHWSFLTGPSEQVTELARLSGVTVEKEGALFNHGFRTIIINAQGDMQMSFPIGGNLSDAIAGEIVKACTTGGGS